MKANFQSMPGREMSDAELDEHYEWLTEDRTWYISGTIGRHTCPEGYEDHYTVDVLGVELEWMNKTFPKEKYTWYIWFESVFIVPPEMLTLLLLKWPQSHDDEITVYAQNGTINPTKIVGGVI